MWFRIISWLAISYAILTLVWIVIVRYRRRQVRQRVLKLLSAKTALDSLAKSTRNRNLHEGTIADQSTHRYQDLHELPEEGYR